MHREGACAGDFTCAPPYQAVDDACSHLMVRRYGLHLKRRPVATAAAALGLLGFLSLAVPRHNPRALHVDNAAVHAIMMMIATQIIGTNLVTVVAASTGTLTARI